MKVWFVGAGPGDPDLMTVKGRRLLEDADTVVYAGSLMPEGLRALAKRGSEWHDSARLALGEFMPLLVEAARSGKKVVRLASGDPAIYGALGEMTEWLEREGLEYEVVPGVSSFLAAAAVLGRELTVPDVAQSIIITRSEGRTGMPEREKLVELAKHRTTLVIFLSAQVIHKIVEDLRSAYPGDTPVAVIHRISWPDEKVLRGTLANIAEKVIEAEVYMTAIVIVGEALTAKGHKSKLYDEKFSHSFRRAKK
ncbi:MAG TPA: precorrin-4 C(11)-methyltransferase [Planctomycetota bacterium]|nr:precorrin-4 C(11)-methyltransferase [Planctomycetota bacterium]